MYKCNKCEKGFENYESLRKHVGRVHKMSSTDFRVEYLLDGKWPLCGCGCGEKVKWSHQIKGFRKYVHGHQSRIKSNLNGNKKAKENSVITRRKLFKSGELKVWNKGLTYETSDSVKKNIDSSIITKNKEENKKKYSSHMKSLWNSGKIKSRFGKFSPAWKGGKSIFQTRARTSDRLYKEWKFPLLKKFGFKCCKCGYEKNLHVHHDEEKFSEIISKIIGRDDPTKYTEEQIQSKINEIVDYHIKNNVSGEVVCYECHKKSIRH